MKRPRIDWNDRIVRAGVVVFVVAAALLVLWHLLTGLGNLVGVGQRIWSGIQTVLSPFIIGGVIAYFIYPAVKSLGALLTRMAPKGASVKRERRINLIATATAFVLLIAAVVLIVAFIVPSFTKNIAELVRRIPGYVTRAQLAVTQFLNENEIFENAEVRTWLNGVLANASSQIMSSATSFATWLVQATVSVSSGFMRGFLGLFVSFYILNERKTLARGINLLLDARLGDARASKIQRGAAQVNDVFYRFLVGRMFESFIVAAISFVGFVIMGTRYSVLFAIINGVTNMVPYFGPLVGGVIIGLLTLLDAPDNLQLLLVMIAFLIAVQGVDAWILGPRVLGDSVGLSPFWVLFGVTVGGGLFGIPGMFVGVPIAACLGVFLTRYVQRKLDPEHGAEGTREGGGAPPAR